LNGSTPAGSRFHRLMRSFVDIQPEEAGGVAAMAIFFFLITSSAYIIKAVQISLFLHRLNFTKLPYAYLITAVFMGFVVSLNTRLLRTLNRRLYLSSSLGFFIIGVVVFWFLFRLPWNGILIIYWLWSNVFLVLSVTQFWILVNDRYQPRKMKRLVSFFVSAGLLGGIFGSLLVTLLAKLFRTENLVLICLVFLAASVAIVRSQAKPGLPEKRDAPRQEPAPAERKAGYWESFRVLSESRYLVLLSAMMAVAIIVSTLIDFQFSAIIKMRFGDKADAQTAFLGLFFTLLLVFAWLLNMLLTNRVLKNFGLKVALLVTPLTLALGAGVLFFVPGALMLAWGVAAKGADKSLTHTFSQATREVLYIPIPPEIKFKAKIFIDVFVNKLGDALAALLVIVFFTLMGATVTQLGFVILVFTAVWVLLDLRLTHEYVVIVKKNLALKWPDADRLVFEQIDVDATKLIFDTLESRERSSVLYAMNLLDLIKREKLSPELRGIIAGKSSEVRAASFDSLLDVAGETLTPLWDDALEEKDLDATVREILSLDVYQDLMRRRIEEIAGTRDGAAVVSQMEIAKALGMMKPDAPLVQNLGRLLRHESPEVVVYALESAGRQKRREFVPLIVRHLSSQATRQAAIRALAEYGDKIAGTVADYLADPDQDLLLRKAVPDVLAHTPTQRAADWLLRELKKRDDRVRAEIVEALSVMRLRAPVLRFPEDEVVGEIGADVRRVCALTLEAFEAQKTGAQAVPSGEPEAVLARTLKQIFELLGLIYSHEDMARAFQNYREGTKRSVEFSLELLENTIRRDLKDILLPILEDRPLDEKAQVCRRILKSPCP